MKREEKHELYFSGATFFGRLLRFFNLLEPGKMVLSISKVFMWAMIASVVVIVVSAPENLTALLSASAGTILSTGNYAYRRHMQNKEGEDSGPGPEEGEK